MASNFYIRVRWIFAACAFLGCAFNFAFKIVISVTIVAMVRDVNDESSFDPNNTVTDLLSNQSLSKIDDGKFDWSLETQNMLQEAFFYGCIASQLPGGRLAERFGAKHVFGTAVLLASIASFFCPLAAHHSIAAFFAVRVLQGLATGVMFPSMHSFIPRWIPKDERSLTGSIIYLGASIGTAITLPLASYLSAGNFLGGWPSAFYALGTAGIVWYICWCFLVYETPEVHPFISEAEIKEINLGCSPSSDHSHNEPLPLKAIFTSGPFFGLLICHFCYNWGFLTILTQLPTYLHGVEGINIKEDGLLSSLPYICQAICGWLMGYIVDRLRTSSNLSLTSLRKIFTFFGILGPVLCFTFTTYLKDSTLVISVFMIALGMSGATTAGFMMNHTDMAPKFAGSLMGFTNAFGNVPGILAPFVVGKLVHHPTHVKEWRLAFFTAASICMFGAIIFIVLASAELQPWDPSYRKASIKEDDIENRGSTKTKSVSVVTKDTPEI